MHDFATRLAVNGLFGYVHHDIRFRGPERITILTGVNGSGKTNVLSLLRSMVGFDIPSFAALPCASAALTYESGKTITFEQLEPSVVRLEGSTPTRRFDTITLRVLSEPLEDQVPPFMERIDEDTWLDRTDGEVMSTASLVARFGIAHRGRQGRTLEVLGKPEQDLDAWSATFRANAIPTLVETRRLDTQVVTDPRSRRTKRALPVNRIRQYVEEVSEQIASARRASLEISQRADRQFAGRALDKARATVKESELRKNYQSLAALSQELNRNGLTEASMGLEFPGGRTNPTERRILSVFLEDWAGKLAPLQDVHQKLQALRAVVEGKIIGKSLVVENGEIRFLNLVTGEPLRVERLSSGEQHLLALFTMLIFTAQPGTLVLIDEPEISLHAAWKHAFLQDISTVANLNDFQVILATHSSGIVHGSWHLAEELSVPELAGDVGTIDPVVDDGS